MKVWNGKPPINQVRLFQDSKDTAAVYLVNDKGEAIRKLMEFDDKTIYVFNCHDNIYKRLDVQW